MELDGLLFEELCGAIFAFIQFVGPLILAMIRLDVIDLANLQGELFSTEATIIFDIAVGMFPELVLNGAGHSGKCFLAHITRDLLRRHLDITSNLLGLGRAAGTKGVLYKRLDLVSFHVNGAVGVESEVILQLLFGSHHLLAHHTLVNLNSLHQGFLQGLVHRFL